MSTLREELKKSVYKVVGMKGATYLRVYSPQNFLQAMAARKRYSRYLAEAQAAYPGARIECAELFKEGILSLPKAMLFTPTHLQNIQRALESEECLSYSKGFFRPGVDTSAEYTFLRKKQLIELGLPEMALNVPAFDLLKKHLGCHLRIVNLAVFKTYPNTFVDMGSFLWHRDSQPSYSFKLIVYLSEVGPEDGPFSYLPGSHRDYSGLPQFGNSRRWRQDPKDFREYYGEPGSGLLFDVNGFHRGGRSRKNCRTVLAIHVKPSKLPMGEHLAKFGFGSTGESEYGASPERIWWSKDQPAISSSELNS